MDAFAKQLYWKYVKRMRYIAWFVAALEGLSAVLLIMWYMNDLPMLDVARGNGFLLLSLIGNLLLNLLPWCVAQIILFTMSAMFVELRCSHCKDSLRRHEKPSGEAHSCKGYHFDIRHFKLVRCGCPAFMPADNL
jgi:hypothetical protein